MQLKYQTHIDVVNSYMFATQHHAITLHIKLLTLRNHELALKLKQTHFQLLVFRITYKHCKSTYVAQIQNYAAFAYIQLI